VLHGEKQMDEQTDMAKPAVAFHYYDANILTNGGYT
jgi:hypothetical protein